MTGAEHPVLLSQQRLEFGDRPGHVPVLPAPEDQVAADGQGRGMVGPEMLFEGRQPAGPPVTVVRSPVRLHVGQGTEGMAGSPPAR
jgi:hypothetical protein